MMNKEHCQSQLKKTISWTTAGQAKDTASSPTHLWKLYGETVIGSAVRTAVVQFKPKTIPKKHKAIVTNGIRIPANTWHSMRYKKV